jgi:hypothetical protein
MLLARAGHGWRLPEIESGERRAADVAPLLQAVGEQMGIEISVLRCLRDSPPDAAGIRRQASEAECHRQAGPTPTNAAWLDLSRPDRVTLSDPAQDTLLRAWLDEQRERAPSADRGEWTVPGWRDRVTSWAQAELRRVDPGAHITRIEQLRVWEFACVLRIRADVGTFFVKVLPRAMATEVALTKRLSETHSELTPSVVAAEPDRGWLLTREVMGAPLMDTPDLACWTRAAVACARIQIDWLDRRQELESLGCQPRSLEWLAAEIDPLLKDPGALLIGQPEGLPEDALAELRARAPQLAAACEELDRHRLPLALEHGDLWAENVIASPRTSVLIDWEDAALAHPFFSPSLLLLSLDYTHAIDDRGEARARLREAYLAPWRAAPPTRRWSSARLEAAFDLAQRVAMLYYAVLFRRFSLPRVETSWEVRTFVPFFARRLLDSLRRG